MKGKIDFNGNLLIERGGEMVLQKCPFGNHDCDQWCPLFGEPRSDKHNGFVISSHDVTVLKMIRDPDILLDMEKETENGITRLKLCNGELVFDEFTDERGKK